MTSAVRAAVALSFLAMLSLAARADTIFEVEHARADYRAGSASGYDEELLDRWGRPSGYYPQYYHPQYRDRQLRAHQDPMKRPRR